MTVTDARVTLAAALSKVSGVTGYEFRPKSIKAGAAWPLLQSLDRGPGNFFEGRWRVLVALGGNEKEAQTKLDRWLPMITSTLESEDAGYVEQAVPALLSTEAGDMFAAEITVRSE